MEMISASSMIPGSKGPHNSHAHPPHGHHVMKSGHQIHPSPHIHENLRLRMDSQKFLVPPLPPSSGRHELNNGTKRKEQNLQRSVMNGLVEHGDTEYHNRRFPIPPPAHGHNQSHGGHSNPPSQQQNPRQHQDSHSPLGPMYADLLHHPLLHQMPTNPANYRSSVPIPCSSPATASSASPKSMSPSTNSTISNSKTYSPQLPSDMNLQSRLFPHPHPNGYPPPHALGLQNNPAAFFAAAAAAHYPLFAGSPYGHGHSHSSASSYLDTFHSNLVQQQMKLSPPTSSNPGGSYMPPHLRVPYHPHGTSTTSLHTKLIESASERYSSAHAHVHSTAPRHDYAISGLHCNGMSKGGPLGIGPTEMPISPHVSIRKVKDVSVKGRPPWYERDPIPTQYPIPKASPTNGVTILHCDIGDRQLERDRESKPLTFPPPAHMGPRESSYKPKPTTSHKSEPEDLIANKIQKMNTGPNIFTFGSEGSKHGRHNFQEFEQNGGGKESGNSGLDLHVRNYQNQFMAPESPRRRKAGQTNWNIAVPSSLNSPILEPNPKYLSAQLAKPNPIPSSPSYAAHAQTSSRVPKSPTVTFKLSQKVPPSPKKILGTHDENNGRSVLPPLPIEEMPMIEPFKQGSLIQLANGDIKTVENLIGEDFFNSAAVSADSFRIVYCTVVAIQEMEPLDPSQPSFCKVTLSMDSESQKQQVILDSTLEQPFFTVARGWSSLCPESSRRALNLQCSSLRIGDICLTLTRLHGKTQSPGTILKTSGITKPRNYTSNILSSKSTASLPKPTGSELKKQMESPNKPMLPPTISTIPKSHSICASPKKRRWSAPEAELTENKPQPTKIDKSDCFSDPKLPETKTRTPSPPKSTD